MTLETINKFQENNKKVLMPNTISVMSSFIKNNIEKYNSNNPLFSYAQGKTGYCWLASGLLCISIFCNRQKELKVNFDLNRLIFFDKLEKANIFFLQIINNIDSDITSHPNAYLINYAMGDKGQWGMLCNLIKKYGLTLVEDEKNLCTKSTQELNSCISYLMRLYALEMHTQYPVRSNSFL
ncbi:MAG: hypothetical protein IJA34_15880 [Lachnospiraceae bacterium]|nr:hypothetical protein [Lachnospiraceae bacterium]